MTRRAKTWRQRRRWTRASHRSQAAQSELLVNKSRLIHDQALFAYARITAPFAGVITQRYANLGTLMQAGTSSSTQSMPLVRLIAG